MTCLQAFETQRKRRLIQYCLYKKTSLYNQNFKVTGNKEQLPDPSDQLQKLFQILQYSPGSINPSNI
jgi:hypothetical protein